MEAVMSRDLVPSGIGMVIITSSLSCVHEYLPGISAPYSKRI
jgi:hypothetical protein